MPNVIEIPEAGVDEVRIEGDRIAVVSGFWPTSFADVPGIVLGAAAVTSLGRPTCPWIAGRKDSRRLAKMTVGPHRRLFM